MTEQDNTIRELLGAWALDAVDDIERAAVERAIANDPELAAEARELRQTVSRIAEADAQQPPEHIREAVLARIAETPQAAERRQRRTEEPDQLTQSRRRRRWQALAAAAAVIIAIAIPTGIAIDQADRADQAELQAEEAAGLAQEQSEQLAQALTDPSAELVAEDLPDGSRAVAVLGESSALFAAHGMTELEDQDYQLWVLDDDQAISAGVLAWEDGRLTAQLSDVPADAALAVTAEPVGGSEQPTSDPMVVLASP